jgi:hypothetical protein
MTELDLQYPEVAKCTERQVLDALGQRYAIRYGNGERYAYAEHVRSHAGFDARRTADAIAMDLWPSKGLGLFGHEVKVSRSDWLRELKDPTKADEFKRYMDRWWLVAPEGVASRAEMPAGWGLMVLVAGTPYLRVVKPAPKLRPPAMPKTMMAAFLRAVAKTTRREVERQQRTGS